VLTYNVHGLPAFITRDDTFGRLKQIAPRLEDYDLVGVQEDWMREGHALLAEPASHPTKLRFADALQGRVYGSGLTVLSRRPAVAQRGEHYGAGFGFDDTLASKGFQRVRLVLAPGVEVDVYNSHLDAGGSDGDQRARVAQVAALTRAMQSDSRGRAVVFLGDTNLKPKRGRDRETLAGWQRETGLQCACLSTRDSCCGQIDRILVRGGLGVTLRVERWANEPGFTDAQGKPLSDHPPVSATLRWSRRPL
jgi:endonuclease/exonuclease/phosphatase family metal-dependent hydrolase